MDEHLSDEEIKAAEERFWRLVTQVVNAKPGDIVHVVAVIVNPETGVGSIAELSVSDQERLSPLGLSVALREYAEVLELRSIGNEVEREWTSGSDSSPES